MSEQLTFEAQIRDRAGKGAARQTRREGQVPCVIYGGKQEPIKISIDPKPLLKALHKPGFFTHVFELKTSDGKSHTTLARDVQFHPVTDRPMHVDFLRVTAKSSVHVNIPVRFENEDKCPGIRKGGSLNAIFHELDLVCTVGQIPEQIIVDLTGLEIGDTVHISDLKLPASVKPADAEDCTIAVIAAPNTKVETEEVPEAEATETPTE